MAARRPDRARRCLRAVSTLPEETHRALAVRGSGPDAEAVGAALEARRRKGPDPVIGMIIVLICRPG